MSHVKKMGATAPKGNIFTSALLPQKGRASRWRVFYQWSLPCLVPEAQLTFLNNCFRKFAACDRCWKGSMENHSFVIHVFLSNSPNLAIIVNIYLKLILKFLGLEQRNKGTNNNNYYHIKPSLENLANTKGIGLVSSSSQTFSNM